MRYEISTWPTWRREIHNVLMKIKDGDTIIVQNQQQKNHVESRAAYLKKDHILFFIEFKTRN